MEVNRKTNFKDKLVLIYGAESEKFNPYLYDKNPEQYWNELYKSYSVEILDGKHGTYFGENSVHKLAGVITKHINMQEGNAKKKKFWKWL